MFAYAANNPVKYTDPDRNAAWTASMWWLTAVDGPLPVGDIIYGIGVTAELIGLLYVANKSVVQTHDIVISQAKTKENNKGPYSVKIQFQGPSIKGKSRTSGEGCVEVNLRSNKPIPAAAVKLAVQEKYSSLSEKEQAALADAYDKVLKKIENAARNGGACPDYKSYPSKTGKPGDRCDFLMTGEINLVP